jgi:hypothetical protein
MTPRTKVSVHRDRMTAVIKLLLDKGFVEDGVTATEQVRIPTVQTPVFGGAGGTLATFGGRQRFSHPVSKVKATVGLVTTFFYTVNNKTTKPIAHLRTKDFDEVLEVVTKITK